jgi:nicotinamidase-related amidase
MAIGTPGLIERDDTILLVIDLQDFFLKKIDPVRSTTVVDNCRFLVEAANQLDIPTFVTVEDPERNGWTTDIVRSRLAPGTPERDKSVFGLCGQSDLREAMLAQPRRTAVLIGLETDVCVLHSAVGLLGEGFRSVIVGDAAGSPGVEHDLGLARAAALGVEIIHTKGVYFEWMRTLAMFRNVPENALIAPPMGSRL